MYLCLESFITNNTLVDLSNKTNDIFLFLIYIWIATQRKEPYVGKIKIEFCIACFRGYSACHFGTKIMYLTQFLTELLRILSFKTCIMKN